MKFRALPVYVFAAVLAAVLAYPQQSAYGQAADAPKAPAAPAAGAYKIGVVNLKGVLKGYDRAQKQYAALQAKVDDLQKDIDRMSKTIEDDKKKYNDNKATMSDDERKALEDKIQSAFRDYQAEMKKRQGTIDDQEKRVLEGLAKEIDEAVQKVGYNEDYHLILDGGVGPSRAVLYFSDTLNMTQKVVDYLNSHTDASAADSAPKGAPAADKNAKKEKN